MGFMERGFIHLQCSKRLQTMPEEGLYAFVSPFLAGNMQQHCKIEGNRASQATTATTVCVHTCVRCAACDWFISADAGGCNELVFFDSDQLLPCFLVTSDGIKEARALLSHAIKHIASAQNNTDAEPKVTKKSAAESYQAFLQANPGFLEMAMGVDGVPKFSIGNYVHSEYVAPQSGHESSGGFRGAGRRLGD